MSVELRAVSSCARPEWRLDQLALIIRVQSNLLLPLKLLLLSPQLIGSLLENLDNRLLLEKISQQLLPDPVLHLKLEEEVQVQLAEDLEPEAEEPVEEDEVPRERKLILYQII
jgi:hypothetical protein